MLIFLSTLAVGLRFVSRRISTGALVREMTYTRGYENLTCALSCFHMETAFVYLSVSGGVLVTNVHEGN